MMVNFLAFCKSLNNLKKQVELIGTVNALFSTEGLELMVN